jgi:excisionase family DNA binding protein
MPAETIPLLPAAAESVQAQTGPPRLLMSPREAAATLALSERTLWALTHPRGPIPCLRIGRCVRYDVEALRGWIQAAQQNGRRS